MTLCLATRYRLDYRAVVSVFQHVLPLPMFAALSSDLVHHAALFSASEPVVAPLLPVDVPRLWLILIANVCTQYPLLVGNG